MIDSLLKVTKGRHSGTLMALLAPAVVKGIELWLALPALPEWVYVCVAAGAAGCLNHFTDIQPQTPQIDGTN